MTHPSIGWHATGRPLRTGEPAPNSSSSPFMAGLLPSRAMLRVALCGLSRFAVAIAVLALTPSARASDAALVRERLRVEPGATCLTIEGLVAEIEPLLDDPRIPDGLTFVVEGSAIDARRARLRVVRGERAVAERAFDPGPELCRNLHAAVGLAIALAIHAVQEEERSATRAWSVSGAGLWTYRLLPDFAPGAEVLARRGFGEHALLRAGFAAVFAIDEALGADGSFDASLLVARLDGCARTRLSEGLRADGCAGFLAGMLHVSGSEVASASSSTVPWVALALFGDLELALSERWALALGISANFLLHRVDVGLESESGARIHRRTLDRFGLALAVGPVYYF